MEMPFVLSREEIKTFVDRGQYQALLEGVDDDALWCLNIDVPLQ